jgi:hypothetical protein
VEAYSCTSLISLITQNTARGARLRRSDKHPRQSTTPCGDTQRELSRPHQATHSLYAELALVALRANRQESVVEKRAQSRSRTRPPLHLGLARLRDLGFIHGAALVDTAVLNVWCGCQKRGLSALDLFEDKTSVSALRYSRARTVYFVAPGRLLERYADITPSTAPSATSLP